MRRNSDRVGVQLRCVGLWARARIARRAMIEQLVNGEPCLVGQRFQGLGGRKTVAGEPSPHGGLANVASASQFALRDLHLVQVLLQSEHAVNIGDSDNVSIGRTYTTFLQTCGMQKKPEIRTVWERVKEALGDAARAGKTYNGVKIKPTQAVAARIAGVTQPSVSEWNDAGRGPELPNALRLAKALDICVEWIYTERGPKRPGPPLDQYAQQLWSMWPSLDEDLKRDLVGYVRIKMQPSNFPPADPSQIQRNP